MKSLHWLIVGVFIVALLGVPVWYATTGQGAQPVPGDQEQGARSAGDGQNKTIRSSGGRSIVGGGRRYGK